jgi:uncharacterized protein YuzE
MKTNLYYYFDQEADVLYFSRGKPSVHDQNRETQDDVILRIDPKTDQVRGVTILNFTRRLKENKKAISLPVKLELVPA